VEGARGQGLQAHGKSVALGRVTAASRELRQVQGQLLGALGRVGT
jgi:hypothetical protein